MLIYKNIKLAIVAIVLAIVIVILGLKNHTLTQTIIGFILVALVLFAVLKFCTWFFSTENPTLRRLKKSVPKADMNVIKAKEEEDKRIASEHETPQKKIDNFIVRPSLSQTPVQPSVQDISQEQLPAVENIEEPVVKDNDIVYKEIDDIKKEAESKPAVENPTIANTLEDNLQKPSEGKQLTFDKLKKFSEIESEEDKKEDQSI